MIQVKCINKIRNRQGVIQYYTLIDSQGNQKTVTSDALKRVIRNNQLECINLTLTSDNRLIDKSDKGIQKQAQPQAQKTAQSKVQKPAQKQAQPQAQKTAQSQVQKPAQWKDINPAKLTKELLEAINHDIGYEKDEPKSPYYKGGWIWYTDKGASDVRAFVFYRAKDITIALEFRDVEKSYAVSWSQKYLGKYNIPYKKIEAVYNSEKGWFNVHATADIDSMIKRYPDVVKTIKQREAHAKYIYNVDITKIFIEYVTVYGYPSDRDYHQDKHSFHVCKRDYPDCAVENTIILDERFKDKLPELKPYIEDILLISNSNKISISFKCHKEFSDAELKYFNDNIDNMINTFKGCKPDIGYICESEYYRLYINDIFDFSCYNDKEFKLFYNEHSHVRSFRVCEHSNIYLESN